MLRTIKTIGFIVIAFYSSILQATPIVDQENWSTNRPFYGVSAEWPFSGVLHAQTFVVNHTGMLQTLELIGDGRNPFSVEIRGQINGHPDSNVLQTVAMLGFEGLLGTTVVPLQLSVVSGELLSFVIYQPDSSITVDPTGGGYTGNIAYGSVGTYANGDVWASGQPQYGLEGPGSWYPNGNANVPMDLYFRTTIETSEPSTVPEPSSLLLLLLALAIMGFVLCRSDSQTSFSKDPSLLV